MEDDFDHLFGDAVPRDRPSKMAAQPPAAPELKPGLQSRGSTLNAGTGVVGDGGASWRLKALKRAQQRSAQEGRSLDDDVRQRFESVAALTRAHLSCLLLICSPLHSAAHCSMCTCHAESVAGAKAVASGGSHLRAAQSVSYTHLTLPTKA